MSLSSDKKILDLIQILKDLEIIRFEREFCSAADILEQNLRNVRTGITSFRPKHIANICKAYNVNANWVFGLSSDIFNDFNLNQRVLEKVLKEKEI